jgi:hypothetical protein
MNWFTKIFGHSNTYSSSATKVEDNTMVPLNQEMIPAINEDLFVDSKAPVQEKEEIRNDGNDIQAFLEQDFHGTGYHDGYTYHTLEMLNNRIKGIKATFRLQLDLAIDRRRMQMLELRTHGIELEGLSESMIRKIEAVEADYQSMITRLEKEKELSAVEEGWVMKPIHEYRDGFLRGCQAYNEEKLIAVSTGLFN